MNTDRNRSEAKSQKLIAFPSDYRRNRSIVSSRITMPFLDSYMQRIQSRGVFSQGNTIRVPRGPSHPSKVPDEGVQELA